MRKLFATTAVALMALAGAASADTAATAATDLNLRSGPGVQHDVTGFIKGGDEVSVRGCITEANWCEVTYGEATGWAYGDYLTIGEGDEVQALYPNRETIGVSVIEYTPREAVEKEATNTAVGMGGGAAVGAIVGGPVGALVGAAIGTVAGASADPAEEVRTYVFEHRQEPVLLDGEVVVGAGIPDSVTLYDIPEHPEYKYLTVNGQPVLVNPEDRKIVHIYR
ncbi:MAG: DUF1236 domain-containing protein [Paracoccus sp. (in: a-proteobacteria)]|uniref:DUF1236 domain-containing protein n=1 Tax=Paracoccus sp. TaxID=267 RepID=UPI0026DF207F|nr:DUF1236 domain-containing protein [Paracoccus sp. (in: a-proteobacteria)]MDO5622868.1 DUF1236 domain-containing protein [Paracoccus sp. (in: a-proteobacteria)]